MGSGIANANELVVVGKYTQTRKRWLKAKTVKSGHGGLYIKDLCRAQKGSRIGKLEPLRKTMKQKTSIEKRREKEG